VAGLQTQGGRSLGVGDGRGKGQQRDVLCWVAWTIVDQSDSVSPVRYSQWLTNSLALLRSAGVGGFVDQSDFFCVRFLQWGGR